MGIEVADCPVGTVAEVPAFRIVVGSHMDVSVLVVVGTTVCTGANVVVGAVVDGSAIDGSTDDGATVVVGEVSIGSNDVGTDV